MSLELWRLCDSIARQAWTRSGQWRAMKRGLTESPLSSSVWSTHSFQGLCTTDQGGVQLQGLCTISASEIVRGAVTALLSRWTEWALEPPHYTTRTEGYWGQNYSEPIIIGSKACNSACSHACTTNEHTFEETLIPLCTPIESFFFWRNTQMLILFPRWELFKTMWFQLKITQKRTFYRTDVRCIF